MNILLSLLIYNPLEAYALILLCDVISGNNTKYNFKNFCMLCAFGFVNLCIQSMAAPFENTAMFPFVNSIAAYIIIPISLRCFYFIISGFDIGVRYSIISLFILCIFTLIISFIVNFIFGFTSFFYNSNILEEFVINVTNSSIQILLYTIIKRKELKYEERCKKYCGKIH